MQLHFCTFAAMSESPVKPSEKVSLSFGIDRILADEAKEPPAPRYLTPSPPFDWLYYTRYHPPRLPRSTSSQPSKRQPGRLPRVPFSPQQLNALESAYKKSMYLSAEEANQIAQKLNLSSVRVKIWFQNRRARDRRENRGQCSERRIAPLDLAQDRQFQYFEQENSS